MMAFRESEGCNARVDKHVSWNGKCCGLESSCSHFLVSFVTVWRRAVGIRKSTPLVSWFPFFCASNTSEDTMRKSKIRN